MAITGIADIAIPSDSRAWRIRLGSFLVPVAHAAGMNVVTVLGLRFLTDSLAISAGAAGLIFAMVKIYDGLLDPAVGAWSDRVQTRWGRRLPFLFAGGLMMPLGLALLFGAPGFGSIVYAEICVALALAIHASGYTLLTIPGFAMVVEASTDHTERTRLMAWRVFGNSVGTLTGTTLPAWVLSGMGHGHLGYLVMAGVVGGLVMLAALLATWLLQVAPRTIPLKAPSKVPADRYRLAQQVRLAWANKPFRTLAIAHIFVLFGTAIGSAAMAYFSRYVLKAGDSWLGSYFMIATIGSVAAMPLWVRLTGVIGKKAGYMGAMAAYGLLNLGWLTASAGESSGLLGARALLLGVAAGGMILCSYALLSDAVRFDYIQSGERREGAFAGFTTLFDKLSAALALAAMGAFLGWAGYVSSAKGSAVPQGDAAILAIRLCVSLIPALSMLAAILVVSRYDLDPATLVDPDDVAP